MTKKPHCLALMAALIVSFLPGEKTYDQSSFWGRYSAVSVSITAMYLRNNITKS